MQEPFSHARPDDHGLWSCPDEEATETEVTALIGEWVRATKPRYVVEIGTYLGYTAQAIGEALRRNDRGHLHTYEVDQRRAQQATMRCEGLPVTVHVEDANSAPFFGEPLLTYVDLIFIDGHLDNRARSWEVWYPRLASMGFAIFHDSVKYPELRGFVNSLPWPKIHLVTPRGLTIVQVP